MEECEETVDKLREFTTEREDRDLRRSRRN